MSKYPRRSRNQQYGSRPKDEVHSFVLGRGRQRRGEIKVAYTAGSDGLISNFALAMICYGENPSDHDRVLGYDTAHRERLGPCHKHCLGSLEPRMISDCGFCKILAEFCEGAQAVARELGCPSVPEEIWKQNCG